MQKGRAAFHITEIHQTTFLIQQLRQNTVCQALDWAAPGYAWTSPPHLPRATAFKKLLSLGFHTWELGTQNQQRHPRQKHNRAERPHRGQGWRPGPPCSNPGELTTEWLGLNVSRGHLKIHVYIWDQGKPELSVVNQEIGTIRNRT